MATILLIDDEEDLLTMVKHYLTKEGHLVITRTSPTEVKASDLRQCELLLLDVMMPGIDGIQYCQSIREQVDCPILFLTAKSMEQDMLTAFASGGDDYLTKPFSLKELAARITVHLRREQREKRYGLQDGDIRLDLVGQRVLVKEDVLHLTQAEFDICALLLKNRGQVFAKESIYEHVAGFSGDGDSQTIITERVKNIRQKFRPYGINPIQTVWGVGYKWERQV